MNLAYGYADINGNNNGQILSITDNVDSTRSMTYEYDAWSRLKTATAGPTAAPTWKLSWDYDRFGNRWGQILALGQGYNTVHSFNTADNRVTTAGFTYDNSGNVTANATGTTFSYNQENFLATASGSISYTYDAQNRRVRKTVGGTVTDYFYASGVVISEKQGSSWTDYIFFGGQRLVKQTGSTASTATYLHADHLGSTRVCTNSSGGSAGTCDYEPFGEFQPGSSCSVPTNYRFAGMEWDSETGLYHTWFRQYDSSQGRWMSVDPLGGSAADPQSLDRYTYVVNDPINLVDPEGLLHDCVWNCVLVELIPLCELVFCSGHDGGGSGSDPEGCSIGEDGDDDVESECGEENEGGDGEPGPTGPSPTPKPQLPPCKGLFGPATVSSPFGNTNPPWYSERRPHPGVDFVNKGIDFAVNVVRGGEVIWATTVNDFGRTVVVEAGPSSYDLYSGLSKITVEQGARIKPGKQIGTAGATFLWGIQKGDAPHLHFQRIEGSLLIGRFVNRWASVQPCR